MDYARHAPRNAKGQIEHWLRLCPIFLDWPADRLQELARSARMRRYRRRTQLVRESHRREILVIASGSIEIAATNAAGDKYILAVLGPGQVARLVQLDDVPSLFAYYAREDSQIIHIPGGAMRQMLDEEPVLWRSIAQLMLRRYHRSSGFRQDQVLASARRRMANMLIQVAQRDGYLEMGACNTELHISQTDLANMLGVSRQTINRELGRLKDEGILGGNDRYRLIKLMDIPELMRIAKED